MDIYSNSVSIPQKSGITGVYWRKNRWRALIRINNKNIGDRHFINLKDAIKHRKSLEEQYDIKKPEPKFCEICNKPLIKRQKKYCSMACLGKHNAQELYKRWDTGFFKIEKVKQNMQGFYKPRFPNKYKGDIKNIIYRSSLELKYMIWLDENPKILYWSSEETIIPYHDKTTNRIRRYFPDFYYKTALKEYIVEIKPANQCKKPELSKYKRRNTFLNETRIFLVNCAKWEAAEKYAKSKNMEFRIITEHDLKKL